MRKIPFLIAFFSISHSNLFAEEVTNCVRSAAGDCIRYDIGIESITNAECSSPSLYLTIGNHYFAQELTFFRGEAILPTSSLSVGIAADWFGYALYHHLGLLASVDKQLGACWNAGCTLRFKHLDYEGNTQRNNRLSCDLFCRFKKESWEIYWKGLNLFGSKTKDGRHRLIQHPRGAIIGALFQFAPAVSCALEGDWIAGQGPHLHIGMEYTVNHFSLRCGAIGLPIKPTFGCGFQLKRMRIDLATQWVRDIGYKLNCGVGYTIKD